MTDVQHPAPAELIRRILQAPSPFYRARILAAGITAVSENDRLTDLLALLPLTRRTELVRDQLEHLPHGTRRFADAPPPVRAGITGTGAELLMLSWTAADLARERAAGARVLARLGVRAGMRIANTLPGALTTPGSLLLGDVIEEIGGLDVPLGSIENATAARQAWELVDRVQAEVLIADAESGARFFVATPPASRAWWQRIIWLRRGADTSAPPPLADSAGFSRSQGAWLALPEATSFFAHACAASRFHVDEDMLAEVVDEGTTTVLPPGAEGTLAVTTLRCDTPVLRYASGLHARAVGQPCICGAGGTVIEVS